VSNLTVYFDTARRRYRVRIRGRVEIKRNVPRQVFESAGVPFDVETKRGAQLAAMWAGRQTFETDEFARRRLTVAEIYDAYRASLQTILAAKTHARNDIHVRNLDRFFGPTDPSSITISDCELYRDERLREGRRARTVKGELSFLLTLLRWGAQRRDVSGMDDLRVLEIPRLPEEDSTGIALSIEEFAWTQVIPLDHYQRDVRNLLVRGVTTGLRLTALVALRWEWIDSDNWLHVPREVMKFSKDHHMPLPQWFFDACPPRQRKGLIDVPPISGERRQWPIGSVKRIVAESGIRYFSAHDLRRTYSTWLTAEGADKLIVSRLLTHAAGDVTEQYIKDLPHRLEQTVSLFDFRVRPKLEAAIEKCSRKCSQKTRGACGKRGVRNK
jgi:integrase